MVARPPQAAGPRAPTQPINIPGSPQRQSSSSTTDDDDMLLVVPSVSPEPPLLSLTRSRIYSTPPRFNIIRFILIYVPFKTEQ